MTDVELDFADSAVDELDFCDVPASAGFSMRDYQQQAANAVRDGWAKHSRQLVVKATGTGKTVLFSAIARAEVNAGGRVLILAHTDELLDQAADKLFRSTGLMAEKEKAGDVASSTATVVVGSIQTLCREARLTGFADDHFSLVIVDEAHRSLAPSYLKILRYFHYGRESLNPGWKPPEIGVEYKHKARVLGVTATDDRGDRRSLGEFYTHVAFRYGLIHAVRDGYLVRPIVKNIPLKIDLRGIKTSRTGQGSDFDLNQVNERITPFLKEIARHIVENARDRKTVCFLPGVQTARLLSEALAEAGLNASFVSGACPDRKEKLEAFDSAGNGSCICNAMLLTEGWDCPDVSCIVVLRPTKIRSLYVQCVGRGTRPLKGVVDGLSTPEERVAAIAASAKPNLLILDFLWLSDKLDLVKPIDLVVTRPDLREKMASAKGGIEGDLIDIEEVASKDLLRSLEAAAATHSKKKTRVIDPLAWSVALGDDAITSWEPDNEFDSLPPTKPQLDFLQKNGVDASKVKYRGLALKLIDRVNNRHKMGLATAQQLSFMIQLGINEHEAALLSKQAATQTIGRILARKRSHQ